MMLAHSLTLRFALLTLAVVASLAGCANGSERSVFGAADPHAERSAQDCLEPAEGCACAGNQPPVACRPDGVAPQLNQDGEPLCLEGTRVCRDGRFSACGDVRAFEPAQHAGSALIDQSATHRPCSDCEPNCFLVVDSLNPDDGPLDGGFASGVVVHGSGGGITLKANAGPGMMGDGGVPEGPLFIAVDEGLTGSGTGTTAYHPAAADVYLLLDQSSSMALENQWLSDQAETGGGFLAATTACVDGDQTQLSAGVTGALACMVDDVRVGAGMFRDIPFAPYSSDQSVSEPAQSLEAKREIAYRHAFAFTPDMSSASTQLGDVGALESSGDPDFAGSQIPALYSVATGAGIFAGIGRASTPDAPTCANGDGYPCFRPDTDRIVVLASDAPMHNGLASQPYPYDPADLGNLVGTVPGMPTIEGNDDWGSAFSLSSNATDELRFFAGNTSSLGAQVPASVVGCGAHETAPDAVFSFDVVAPGGAGSTVPITVSAEGTGFASSLVVYDNPPLYQRTLPASTTNERFDSAYPLGNVRNAWLDVTGNTAGMAADLQGSVYEHSCTAATRTGDAIYQFELGPGAPAPIELSVAMGSDSAFLGVYEQGSSLPPLWPAVTSPFTPTNNRDATPDHVLTLTPFPAVPYTAAVGTTIGMGAEYDSETLGNGICNMDSDSEDVSFKLQLNARRRLRIDTEGSSFDTLLALHDGPPLPRMTPFTAHTAAATHGNTNEDAASAWQTGVINGRVHTFAGNTSAMSADVDDQFSCGLDDGCGDAMYKITISTRTTVRMEATGTGFQPGISLARGNPEGASGAYGSVASGGAHSCAIAGGQVFCWGADDAGQLGDGGSSGAPDSLTPVGATGLSSAAQLCAGESHSCAVLRDGSVACWGAGAGGRLGNGGTSDQTSPDVLTAFGPSGSLGRAVQVGCGDAFSCVLLEDGRIACFGDNAHGQLGDGTMTGRSAPMLVAGGSLRFSQLALAARHGCAVRIGDGALFCWGEGSYGKLGNGTVDDNLAPARAGAFSAVRSAFAGEDHSCAVLSSGKVLCWGRNQAGQLGIGASDGADHVAPFVVQNSVGDGELVNARGGAAGRTHTCVNTLEGLVQCWGDNGLRQLGNGGTSITTLPSTVALIDGVAQLAGTRDHNCAVGRDGRLHCWGDNSHGQLGNGATATPTAPVPAHPSTSAPVSFGGGQLEAGVAHACGSIAERPEAGCELRLRSGRAYSVCEDQARTWAGAAQACESVGMELAKIDASGENAFIANQLDAGDRAWIGAKRESSDSSWTALTSSLDFETLSGDRIWHTRSTAPVRGFFQAPAASDLVSSDPAWTASSTWASSLDPSPVAAEGENCVTLSSTGKWETQPCSSSAPFDGRGGRFAAPLFAGGAERPYVCEERARYTEVTLDPGDYYVMVKGVDDGVVGNTCAGAYELKLTDVGALGDGRFIACNDDGEPFTSDAVIETTLDPGDYYVTLKGWRSYEHGNYRLTVRDLDAVTTDQIACDEGLGSSEPARVNFIAQPSTRYYAVVKGVLPNDQGPFALTLRDTSATDGDLVACDAASSASGNPELAMQLESGTYYAVLKGSAPGASGDYQLSVGGASPVSSTFEPAGYDATVDALEAAGIRVASVLSCADRQNCDDALAQAEQLAADTGGVARMAATPDVVPLEIVRAVEQLERADSVTGSLSFAPDANPGFTPYAVTALADPGNRCAPGASGAMFTDCLPGALPSFVVSLHNPALAPVPFSSRPSGAYEFTLHVESERDGVVVGTYDLPVTVLPTGAPPPNTYTDGSYFQDMEAKLCKIENRPPRPGMPMPGKQVQDERPSWDALRFDADVRPDTQLDLYVCTADSAADLAACNAASTMATRRRRALTVTAGTGMGTSCDVATQTTDCPGGYCSPYTHVCNYLEGADCLVDTDCPGTEPGRCRRFPSAAGLGDTCEVPDLQANPASALDGDNLRPFMRMEAQLTALGDQSRTPSLFFWEAWYRCRMVE